MFQRDHADFLGRIDDLEAERDAYRSALANLLAATFEMKLDVATIMKVDRARDEARALLKDGPNEQTG